jgi:hypothetical protein
MKHLRTASLCTAIALVGAVLGSPAPASAAPPLPGAIFTTTVNGTVVNGNIYAAKCDVYLDGGPGPNAPQTAAGLPDGDYYFQVTDPSGKTLLSTDIVANRRVTVANGIFTAAFNHNTGVDTDWSAATVQLCNYNDTPNNGGEYKVWVTPVGDFVGNTNVVDNGYSSAYFHGFIAAASKTDNFKVKAKGSVCLTVQKFEDDNADGKKGYYEPLLVWQFIVTGPSGDVVEGLLYTGTPETKFPEAKVCGLTPGTYTVTEVQVDGWTVTGNVVDGKSSKPAATSILVAIRNTDRVVMFGNAPPKK